MAKRSKLCWYSGRLNNLTNGSWAYVEIKAKSKKDAKKLLEIMVQKQSGHCIVVADVALIG
jgi:hypothetical protein